MVRTPQQLPGLLRSAANRLENGADYEWGHMGRCNCGHLVQSLTSMTSKEIVQSIDHRLDEWSEHAKEYCSATGSKVEDLFRTLAEVGFTYKDVMSLEYLNDPLVLQKMGDRARRLRHNSRADVVAYMRTLAELRETASSDRAEQRELATSPH